MELMGTSPKIDLYSHPLFLRMVNEHGFERCDKDIFPQFLQKQGLSNTKQWSDLLTPENLP